MTFRTNALKVQAFAGALFGVQVGTTTMAQVNADIISNGGLANTLNGYYASSFGSVPTATVAASVAANLGLTGDALTAGTAYVLAQLNAAAPSARGAVISNILDLFSSLASDATYGAAATAWNARVTTANEYTGATNVSFGSTVSQGAPFTLTSGADNITGTAGNDTIKAIIDAQDAALGANSAKLTTLNATDDIAGGAGTDTLTILANGTAANSVTPIFLSGVEKVSVKDVDNTAAAGTTVNLVNATGVNEVINDGSVAAVTFDNIGSAAVTIQNVTTGVGTTFSRSTATPVASDLTINLTNVGRAVTAADATAATAVQMGALTSAGATSVATKATINTTTYANVVSVALSNNTVDTLTVNAAGTTIFGAAGAPADITGFDATKSGTINVTGAGAVTLNTLDAAVQTVNASAASGAVTLAGTVYGGTNAAALAAAGLKLTGGAGNDSFTFDGVGSAVVDMGAGNDIAIINAGTLAAGASIRGGDGTDTVQLNVAGINALEAQTAAGTALRATISGFERLGVTGDLTGAINAARAGGYNHVVMMTGVVDNGDGGNVADESVNISGLTNGATVEFRALGVYEDIAEVLMTDAALSTTDSLNISLNANLAAAAGTNSQATVKVGIAGINNVNVTANDRVNDVTDDDLTAATDAADNGAGDGYTLALSNAANLNTLTVSGSSFVSYTLAAGTDAITMIDASASTGNFTANVAAFAGTQRLEIKGSQGTNNITGDNAAFGERITGGARADTITGGAGADDMTGNGGRDAFIQGAGESGTTSATVDQISDFGRVTIAATAAEVTAMTGQAQFQAPATARGGADADMIDFTAVSPTAVATAQSAADEAAINTALEALDGTQTEFAGKVINATITKGILTVGGADAAMVDTLAEWVAVANIASGANGETAAFQFNGNTYVFQQQAAGDELVELTGVTGVTGVVLVGGAVAAAVGNIFVL